MYEWSITIEGEEDEDGVKKVDIIGNIVLTIRLSVVNEIDHCNHICAMWGRRIFQMFQTKLLISISKR